MPGGRSASMGERLSNGSNHSAACKIGAANVVIEMRIVKSWEAPRPLATGRPAQEHPRHVRFPSFCWTIPATGSFRKSVRDYPVGFSTIWKWCVAHLGVGVSAPTHCV